ncbi:MAG TPA: hypothetical protein EYN51_12345 [Flavobacteriales bacterium]|nr:hypothetical protein [Flavobacteriales bacterium]
MTECFIAETSGQSLQQVSEIDYEHFTQWQKYFETNPPLRQHLNYCLAQVSQRLAALATKPGGKVAPFKDFIIDYQRDMKNVQKIAAKKLDLFFGGLVKNKEERSCQKKKEK